MSVIINVAVKTAVMTALRDYFANGTLEILSASNTVLAIFGLSASGGTLSGAVWTLTLDANTVNGQAAAGGGTAAAKAQIKNGAGNAHLTGLTVGLSSADVILDNTSIASGQAVTLTSLTITHPADPS